MSESALITILLILLFLLILILLSYFIYPDEKITKHLPIRKKEKKPAPKRDKPLRFEEIQKIFSYKKSSKEELQEGIEQLVLHHGKIHAKLGDLPHPDFKRYLALIIELCNNPQSDKDIIVSLDQKLQAKNPRYGLDIDEATNKGIASRGF